MLTYREVVKILVSSPLFWRMDQSERMAFVKDMLSVYALVPMRRARS